MPLLILLHSAVSEPIDVGEVVLALFLNLQKAFGKVNHQILLCKLESYGFLILRLGAPTWILRGGSPVFKRFGPLNLLTFLGGGLHPAYHRMSLSVYLSFGTQRLPPAMRGSLWPSYADPLLPGLERLLKALNGFFMFVWINKTQKKKRFKQCFGSFKFCCSKFNK